MRIMPVLLVHYGESHRLVKEDYQDLLLPPLSSDNEMSSSVIQTNCDYNDRFQTVQSLIHFLLILAMLML